eukprot:GILK01004555.1.p1 GENE.GILK01004555.1~~GILK01004555.1.p1  ORF type:complete len:597 (+),score=107.48 GILK01004555.1:35-1825(+)
MGEGAAWEIVLLVLLICISSVTSALAVSLLGLDKSTIQALMQGSGTDSSSITQADYARRIWPLRKDSALVGLTLSMFNTAANVLIAIFSARAMNFAGAFFVATGAIFTVGDFLPQAICARYGLALAAHLTGIAKVMVTAMYFICKPLSKLMNFITQSDKGAIVFTKQQVKALFGMNQYAQIGSEERKIISGALDFGKKKVADVMLSLDDVFMLDISQKLDFTLMKEIFQSGSSRVPVYEKTRTNIVGFLVTKDLIVLDYANETPIDKLLQFFGRQLFAVDGDASLIDVLMDFKHSKCHLAAVRTVQDTGEGDPFYEHTGIITFERLVEEILQDAVGEDSNAAGDWRTETKAGNVTSSGWLSLLGPRAASPLSDLEIAAIASFLSSSVTAFYRDAIPLDVLHRLIAAAAVVDIQEPSRNSARFLYQRGKPETLFTLILSGRVEIAAGQEGFLSEAGPWTTLGTQTLLSENYTPDFTAKVVYAVRYLRISRQDYLNATRGLKSINSSSRDLLKPHESILDSLHATAKKSPPQLVVEMVPTSSQVLNQASNHALNHVPFDEMFPTSSGYSPTHAGGKSKLLSTQQQHGNSSLFDGDDFL